MKMNYLTLGAVIFACALPVPGQSVEPNWYIRSPQLESAIVPLFPVPNHPSFPSNHSAFSATRAEMLAYLFPARADFARAFGKEGGVVAVDSGGNLYIANSGNTRISIDSGGKLYITDSGNARIRKVSRGVTTTVAGTGTPGFSGDNGPATSAQLNSPGAVAVDSGGNLYIADSGNGRIRKVSGGVITTVAGAGQLNDPRGVAVDSAGNLYITDSGNARIRKVSGGAITTVAGIFPPGFSGDDGPGTRAQLNGPRGVAVDSAGNVYVADSLNNRVRLLQPQRPK